MVRCESRSSTIGHITLGTKQTGAPSAGNPHAGCDVAGAGNGFTVWLLRHSQRKRGGKARLDLRSTAPVLDPTNIRTLAGNVLRCWTHLNAETQRNVCSHLDSFRCNPELLPCSEGSCCLDAVYYRSEEHTSE